VARAYGTRTSTTALLLHNASSVRSGASNGSGTASITLDDLGRADLVLLAGANPASNHPRLIGQLVALRRRGGKVIVVNRCAVGLVRFRVPRTGAHALRSTVSDVYLSPTSAPTSRS